MKPYYTKLERLVKDLQSDVKKAYGVEIKKDVLIQSKFDYLIGYVQALKELSSDNSVQDY